MDPEEGEIAMAGIDVLTYASGKEVFVLSGDGIEGHHKFDSYPEALNALKKIRGAKEDYERLRATQDKSGLSRSYNRSTA